MQQEMKTRGTRMRTGVAMMMVTMLATLVGCNASSSNLGAGGSQQTPIITAFAASATAVLPGSSSVLTWSVYGATSVTLSGSSAPATSPTTVTPTVSTTYTLTATNSAGTSTATVTVLVDTAPVLTSLVATPSTINAGGSTSLSWALATEVGSLQITYVLTGVSGVSTNPTQPVTAKPAVTTTYTLTATNAVGQSTVSTTVTVLQALPVIASFTASTNSITAGQPVKLTWSVTGVGVTTTLSGVTTGAVSPVTVYPAATTTYTLSATNNGGTVTAAQAITVAAGTTLNTGGGLTLTAGQSVPATFMGFSIGGTTYAGILGIPATGVNPIYRKLMKNLTAYGQGPIIMRIGGNSEDTLTAAPTAATVSSLAQLSTDMAAYGGEKFILGLSMAADNVNLAVSEAQAFATTMPTGSIIAGEIGNEPDLYLQNAYRSPTYTNAQYLTDFANFRSQVLPVMTAAGAKIAGPAWSSTSSLTNLPSFIAQESANLAVVTQHAYGGTDCNGNTVAGDYLLQEAAQSGAANAVSGVAPSHNAGLLYRLGESNTISCSGQNGVSNTFQAALWSMDWMSRLAAEGVDGINFFGDNTQAYSIFEFNTTGSTSVTYSIGFINPQYYGLLLFQQATQNGAKFIPLTYTASGNQKAYAWLDASGNIRVLILNKDEAQSGTFSITLSGYQAATTTRLTAPLYTSTSGGVLGGQTMDGSTDGSLLGAAYGEVITPVSGVYTVAMPITSAVLLTIPHN